MKQDIKSRLAYIGFKSFQNYILGSALYDKIWVYRLPSLFGIILSFLFIFKFVQSIYSREVGLLSVFFLAISFLENL